MGKYQKFYDEYGKNAPIWQKRLCERMTELNINQEELAKACGVSKSAVNGWVKNGVVPKADFLQLACLKLNVTMDYLMGNSDVKSLDIESIQIGAKTGLSDPAIETLIKLNSPAHQLQELRDVLNDMFSSSSFLALLRSIANYKALSHVPYVTSSDESRIYCNQRDIEEKKAVEMYTASQCLSDIMKDIAKAPIKAEYVIELYESIYHALFDSKIPLYPNAETELSALKRSIETNTPISEGADD